ncbi:MAG: hypothetical protein F7C38_04150 [Desulfurococcales archaeon]|nr:hypothetical protein [Desulfurococcales archaeon]
MKTYSLEASASIALIGVPLANSENPFLSIPIGRTRVDIAVGECSSPRHKIGVADDNVAYLLSGFIANLEEITSNKCLQININSRNALSRLSAYSLATTLIVHALAKYHSETLDTWEILEIARYADPIEKPSGWTYVIDSTRYSTLTGTPVVFRNDEEFAKIETTFEGDLSYKSTIEATTQKLTREALGGDVYNSLVRMVGVMTLEAAVKLREEGNVVAIAETLGKLQNGLIASIWDIDYPPPNCINVPGLPGEFDTYCW